MLVVRRKDSNEGCKDDRNKKSVFANNDAEADRVRKSLKEKRHFL